MLQSVCVFFFSSRRRHTRLQGDWSSDVCSSDLVAAKNIRAVQAMDFPVQWKVLKQGSGIVTKSVGGLQLPTVKDLVLDDKSTAKGADEGNLILKSTLATPLVKFDLVPRATIQTAAQEEA